ncbi:MAG: hypothetical protein A2Y17_13670 [Clostridiales bacterium GWF2_38_85]|nr:MAG: hypothetical protein A2Y17_13670 [Clostridiales bacterium GWF2_38_85]
MNRPGPRLGGPGGPHMAVGPKPKNAKRTFFRLISYMGKYKTYFIFVIIGMILSAAAGVTANYFIKPLINDYIAPMIGQQNPDYLPLIKQLLIMATIFLIGVAATYLSNRLAINISAGVLYKIRTDMYEKMQKLPIKFFDTRTHGEIMSRYTNDANSLSQMISMSIPQLISSLLSVVGVFGLMLYLSWALTLIVIGMLGLYFLVLKFVGGQSAKYFRMQQKDLGSVNGYLEEMIEGQKVVKVFSYEDKVLNEFTKRNNELFGAASKANTFANILMPIMGNLSYLHYAITAAVGAILTINGQLDVGTVGAFLQSTRQFSQPLTQISTQINSVLMALAGAERIFEVMDAEPENDDGVVTLVNINIAEDGSISECNERTGIWAWKYPHSNGSITYTRLQGHVVFENITFGYDENKTVLKNVSLYAKTGQKIAFVGSTGAGKTTITNLINRFYDVPDGKIRYDGININKIKKADLRRSLAMVLQDTHLFTGTVKDNIRYGKLDATDEDIVEAAKIANADTFIRHLSNGYDTVLSGDGSNLSQGQRQLLSIARAAVADPPVLILDEATSSVDTRTELLIEKGMDKLMEGRTVFVIAHRLSTVRNSDAIMVLESGEIIERGNHEDLISQQGKYYQLYTGMFELD